MMSNSNAKLNGDDTKIKQTGRATHTKCNIDRRENECEINL